MEEHIANLCEEDRLEVERKEVKSSFRFCNGKSFKFKGTYILPIYFGNERAMICVDVIDSKLPLLISLAAIKKTNTVIDSIHSCYLWQEDQDA